MKPTRRGFFRMVLALPFAPKCIQAFRPKPCQHMKALTSYSCAGCGRDWGEIHDEAISKATRSIRKAMGVYEPALGSGISMTRTAYAYLDRGHTFYQINPEKR